MSGSDQRALPLCLAAAAGAAALLAAQQLGKLVSRRSDRSGVTPTDGSKVAAAAVNGASLWADGPPHPGWKPPQKMAMPFSSDQMHEVDPSQLPGDVLYPLIISAIVPRPVAFVSTQNSSGVGNLAPFSYFNVMSHNPPYVCIGFANSRLRSHGRKDTLHNLLETGDFVVNIMSEWFIEAANYCCGNFDYGENEMELSGLTPLPSVKVKPPRVKESAVHMECQLRHTYDVKDKAGTVTGTIVIGEVVLMHIHDGVAGRSPSGKLVVSMQHYQPISRLGGSTYARTSGQFDLPRPDRDPATQKQLAYTSKASTPVLSS